MTRLALVVLGGALALSGCAEVDTDAAVRQCVGAGFAEDDSYVGGDEQTVVAELVARGQEVRVLGRDGGCENRHDDRNEERVNLYLVDGLVAWAGTG